MEQQDYTDYINESVGLPQRQDYGFSIKSNTACEFKWTWSTLFLSRGTSSSCHRCKGWDVTEHMQDFHNHPGKLHDRGKMLEGKWPGNGCEYCKKIEESGGTSERLDYINTGDFEPPELAENPNEIRVTPRILEVYFTNLCNQACAYCSPFFSSKIQKEIEKFGPLEKEYDLFGFETQVDYKKLKVEFWEWMDKNSRFLNMFHILGGEPLYQPEFQECLNFFEERSHPHLKWKIFSNLKHNPDKFRKKLERISYLIKSKKLGGFQVVCSQDCWGPQAEFARYGLKLDNWETNFNTLLEFENVEVSIHSTISPVTLPTMAEFYKKINTWNKRKNIVVGWNTIKEPSFMNPEIIGHHAKKYFDDLIQTVKDGGFDIPYLEGFREQVVNHDIDEERLHRLCVYLDKLDERRNTDWKSLYPWLDELWKKNPYTPNEDDENVVEKFIEEELNSDGPLIKEYRNIVKKDVISN